MAQDKIVIEVHPDPINPIATPPATPPPKCSRGARIAIYTVGAFITVILVCFLAYTAIISMN